MSDTRAYQSETSYQVWEVPELLKSLKEAPVETVVETSVEDTRTFEQGYVKGYAAGVAEARSAQKAERSDEAQKLDSLFSSLQKAFKGIDDKTINELAQLSALVAEQVIKTELMLKPELISDVVQNLVSQLPHGYQRVEISLHPDDLRTLADYQSRRKDPAMMDFTLVEDESLTRGDCRLTTDDSMINAELRSHVESIINKSMDELLTSS